MSTDANSASIEENSFFSWVNLGFILGCVRFGEATCLGRELDCTGGVGVGEGRIIWGGLERRLIEEGKELLGVVAIWWFGKVDRFWGEGERGREGKTLIEGGREFATGGGKDSATGGGKESITGGGKKIATGGGKESVTGGGSRSLGGNERGRTCKLGVDIGGGRWFDTVSCSSLVEDDLERDSVRDL